MKKISGLSGLLLCLLIISTLTACSSSPQPVSSTITIAAAASLELPLLEIIEKYNQSYPDLSVSTSFSGSRIIEQQIIQGAPVDIFLSASPESGPALIQEAIIDPESLQTILTNSLVLAAHNESELSISSLTDLNTQTVKTLGLGDPDSVPAGTYAKEALIHYGIWENVSEALIFTQDVRQVLTLLETNNIDAGFIYQTDFLSGRNIKRLYIVPADSHSPVLYQAMLVNQDRSEESNKNAQLFYNFIQSDDATDIFIKYGFSIP